MASEITMYWTAHDDQRFGIDIVRKAVQAPLRKIVENSGEGGAVIAGKVLDKDDYAWGFDAPGTDAVPH